MKNEESKFDENWKAYQKNAYPDIITKWDAVNELISRLDRTVPPKSYVGIDFNDFDQTIEFAQSLTSKMDLLTEKIRLLSSSHEVISVVNSVKEDSLQNIHIRVLSQVNKILYIFLELDKLVSETDLAKHHLMKIFEANNNLNQNLDNFLEDSFKILCDAPFYIQLYDLRECTSLIRRNIMYADKTNIIIDKCEILSRMDHDKYIPKEKSLLALNISVETPENSDMHIPEFTNKYMESMEEKIKLLALSINEISNDGKTITKIDHENIAHHLTVSKQIIKTIDQLTQINLMFNEIKHTVLLAIKKINDLKSQNLPSDAHNFLKKFNEQKLKLQQLEITLKQISNNTYIYIQAISKRAKNSMEQRLIV
jgi:hypothetical protein